jgi:hypothetical protein
MMRRPASRRRLVFLVVTGWIIYKAAMEDVTRGDWYIIGIILVLEAVLPFYWWMRTKWQLRRTFTLQVPDSQVSARADGRGVEVGIFTRAPISIQTFTVRFVSGRSLWLRGFVPSKWLFKNVSPKVIQVTSVTVHDWNNTYTTSDTEGGIRCALGQNPIVKYAGEVMRLRVNVVAPGQWSGHLRFHSYDSEGNDRYSSQPFTVTQAMQPASQTQAP